MMYIETQKYLAQEARWPKKGRHILAQWTDDSIIVYQAYRAEIGAFAATHNYFGGAFSLARMSWIKPNFLWMMYRSGWGTKPGQEVVLAVRIKRSAFDDILSQAIHSSFDPEIYESKDAWQKLVKSSDVRLQWDPDHTPTGAKHSRRAIQLGLRGAVLQRYARDWIIDIEDVSQLVRAQRENCGREREDQLVTPLESVYPVTDIEVRRRLALDASELASASDQR